MNKKAIIPPYMLLFYKQKYGDITRKIHVAPIYHSKNSCYSNMRKHNYIIREISCYSIYVKICT